MYAVVEKQIDLEGTLTNWLVREGGEEEEKRRRRGGGKERVRTRVRSVGKRRRR